MPAKRQSDSGAKGPGKRKQQAGGEWASLSTISARTKINKRRSTELYRLKDKEGDFEGLKYKTVQTSVRTRWGQKSVTMTVYSERDIERAAWKKHGGPAGFVAFLEDLHTKHSGLQSFEWPFPYNTASKRRAFTTLPAVVQPEPGASANNAAPAPSVPVVPAEVTEANYPKDPTKEVQDTLIKLAQNRDTMLPGALETLPQDVSEQMFSTLAKLPNYPQRTPIPVVLSPQFMFLKETLAKAPPRPGKGGLRDFHHPNLHIHEGEGNRLTLRWTNAFVNEVSLALVPLIDAHGFGDPGWKAARWMVYDAWTRSVGGVDWEAYTDSGLFWLIGRVPESDIQSLPFAGTRTPDVWSVYNTMLPKL